MNVHVQFFVGLLLTLKCLDVGVGDSCAYDTRVAVDDWNL